MEPSDALACAAGADVRILTAQGHGKGGIVMTDRSEIPHHEPVPGPGEPPVPSLEEDESAAPRPEEEIADQLRSEPDPDARPDGDG